MIFVFFQFDHEYVLMSENRLRKSLRAGSEAGIHEPKVEGSFFSVVLVQHGSEFQFLLILIWSWIFRICSADRFWSVDPWSWERKNNLLAIWYCLWINCFDRIFQERKMGKRSRFLMSFVKMNWKIIQNNPKFLPIASLFRLINVIRYLWLVFEFSH